MFNVLLIFKSSIEIIKKKQPQLPLKADYTQARSHFILTQTRSPAPPSELAQTKNWNVMSPTI
jgi:hypothetical protein